MQKLIKTEGGRERQRKEDMERRETKAENDTIKSDYLVMIFIEYIFYY